MALSDEDKQWISEQLGALNSSLHDYIDQRTYNAETRLLRAFSDYNTAANVRLRKLESDTGNIDTSTTVRLGELERRLTDLEIRTIRLEGA